MKLIAVKISDFNYNFSFFYFHFFFHFTVRFLYFHILFCKCSFFLLILHLIRIFMDGRYLHLMVFFLHLNIFSSYFMILCYFLWWFFFQFNFNILKLFLSYINFLVLIMNPTSVIHFSPCILVGYLFLLFCTQWIQSRTYFNHWGWDNIHKFFCLWIVLIYSIIQIVK